MRPILIAECCQNHNGSRDTLRQMVHAATDAGADYVKIQALYSSDLTLRERFEEGVTNPDGTVHAIKRPYGPERERLSGLDLTPDDEEWFVDECLRAGVGSMITAFTRGAVPRLGELGFEAVKIASYDCRSYPLLREVSAFWSRIFVSTGASTDVEIQRAAAELAGTDLTLLHCVTIYPTPMDQLHLRRLNWLRGIVSRVGWSDHTAVARDGVWAAKIALALGTDAVERHFTVLDASETKDGPVSIDPTLLKELRSFADRPRMDRMEIVRREYPDWARSLGRARRDLTEAELLNRDYYGGRVASKVGGRDVFNWEDVDLASLGYAGAGL